MVARMIALLTACALGAGVAAAHDLSHSQSDITMRDRDVHSRLQVDLIGFGGLQWRAVDRISYEELDERIEAVFALVKTHIQIAVPGSPPPGVTLARYTLIDNHVLDADIVYRFAAAPSELTVRSTLDRITAFDHQHLARVDLGGGLDAALLTAGSPAATFSSGSRWRRYLFSTAAGARSASTTPATLLLACLVGFGASAPGALLVLGLAVAGGGAGGLALSMFGATALPVSPAPLGNVALAVLAVVTGLDARVADRSAAAAIFMLTWALAVSGARRAQGLDDILSMAAYLVGAVAAIALLACAVFAIARRVTRADRTRRAIACAAMVLSVYWLLQPWTGD